MEVAGAAGRAAEERIQYKAEVKRSEPEPAPTGLQQPRLETTLLCGESRGSAEVIIMSLVKTRTQLLVHRRF